MIGLLLPFLLRAAPLDVPLERATPAHEPVLALSNESNTEQLQSAQAQGRAQREAVDWVRAHALAGGAARADDYQIVWTLSPAEGSWLPAPAGGLAWHDAPPGTVHLRAFVLDAADGRLVPELTVRARLAGDAGPETLLGYGRYPLLDAYGANVRLPADGPFRLRLDVSPLPGRRHDSYNGYRFTKPAFAAFRPASLDPAAIVAAAPESVAETVRSNETQAIRKAFDATLRMMDEQANDGRERTQGDWQVAYAIEYSEGWWCCEPPAQMSYTIMTEYSAETNSHVEVAPRDARTGRFLPGLKVTATLLAPDGKSLGTRPEPFMWHPWLYHYGENWRVPRGGRYNLRVHIDPPAYPRYGREAGDALGSPVDMTFDDVKIKTGQK